MIGAEEVESGPYRQRVTIQQFVEADDAYGQRIKQWSDVGTYWARVRNLTGRELWNAKQIYAQSTHGVEMRYVGAVAPTQRLLWGSLVFEILWANNVENRNRKLYLLCVAKLTGV